VVRTVHEFKWTSAEIKEKNANKQMNFILMLAYNLNVGNFLKPSEIKFT